MNMMLAPSNAATLKAKRRESSMLFMGIGHRKSTVPKTKDESGQSNGFALDRCLTDLL